MRLWGRLHPLRRYSGNAVLYVIVNALQQVGRNNFHLFVPAAKIKNHGGEFFMQLPSYPGVDAEKKFKDINGVVFDVAEHDWRQSKDN